MRNLCFVATAFFVTASLPCQGGPFSFPNGQAPRDVVIPAVVPVLFEAIKPGDAPLILRTTTLLNNVWFDAIAPYSDTAVGICSTIPRRPAAERNDTNRNIAIFYASLRMLDSLFPAQGEAWRAMDEAARAPWEVKAKADKVRYEEEMKKYNAGSSSGVKTEVKAEASDSDDSDDDDE